MYLYNSHYQEFLQDHHPNEIVCNGIHWNYLTGGNGAQTIPSLHGGGGAVEFLFRYLSIFEKKYRVIAPTIPAGVVSVSHVLEGISNILKNEPISSFDIFGVSNSGMIAQCLVQQHPERVESLILLLSMLPGIDYASLFGRRAKILSLLPGWAIKSFGLRWVKKEILSEAAHAAPEEITLWQSYFTQFYQFLLASKAYFVSRAKILADYFPNYSLDRHDLDDWPDRILIIESENDQVVNRVEREHLVKFYQQADVLTLRGVGHLGGGLFKVDETMTVIEKFLSRA